MNISDLPAEVRAVFAMDDPSAIEPDTFDTILLKLLAHLGPMTVRHELWSEPAYDGRPALRGWAFVIMCSDPSRLRQHLSTRVICAPLDEAWAQAIRLSDIGASEAALSIVVSEAEADVLFAEWCQ